MQSPPQLSLIVATLGREAELARCLGSLAAQTSLDFEVVVVDQNVDDRVAALLDRERMPLPLAHVHAAPGLSRARNVGLRLARGNIVGFPDDDCWYDVDTVARILQFFAGQPSAHGLSGGGAAGAGGAPRGRFARDAQWVTAARAWTQGMSSAIFLRRELIAAVGPFDEALGVGSGTPWPAAEETDYLLRAVAWGARIWYDPRLAVHHPGSPDQPQQKILERGRRYGRAMGYVLAKHRRSRIEIAYHAGRAMTGAMLSLLRARWDEARLHAAVARGRIRGWRDGVAARGNTLAGAPNERQTSTVKQPV